MTYIPDRIREQVIDRARERCEYCQTQQVIVISMEIDHIIPESAGGSTELDNLCYACISCNGSKLDSQVGVDPNTNEEVPLFNPRLQSWTEQFRWSDDGLRLVGLTSLGRATINRLRMNRDAILRSRQRWVEAGWHPPDTEG